MLPGISANTYAGVIDNIVLSYFVRALAIMVNYILFAFAVNSRPRTWQININNNCFLSYGHVDGKQNKASKYLIF